MGRWDSFAKLLIALRPWQFVGWLMAGAELVEVLSVELKTQELLADALLKVRINGQLALIHIEFQSYQDANMGKRLLEYNVGAEHQYGLPVSSFVIYLRKRKVPRPPYIRKFVDGHTTHHFFYRVVKLWEIPAEAILNLEWEGLLPLLPLMRGGKKAELVEVMLSRLGQINDKELLALAQIYGGLAFTSPAEKARFKRRFKVFQDIMKDSWVYQEIVQESEERGLEKGLEEGLEKGLLSHRQTIIDIVNRRFPLLDGLAAQQVARVADLDVLRMLVVNISVSDDGEVVRKLLMDAVKK